MVFINKPPIDINFPNINTVGAITVNIPKILNINSFWLTLNKLKVSVIFLIEDIKLLSIKLTNFSKIGNKPIANSIFIIDSFCVNSLHLLLNSVDFLIFSFEINVKFSKLLVKFFISSLLFNNNGAILLSNS